MVVKDGKAAQTEVETGIRDGGLVQITKGLKGGETIIVRGAYGLPDKTKVKIAEEPAAEPEKPGAAKPGADNAKD
jgi:membrane fusion protein (multidrug efflux system)